MNATNLNCFHCVFAEVKRKYCGWIPCRVFKKRVRCGSLCDLLLVRERLSFLSYS